MAERLNRCPKCGAFQYGDVIVKAHDPDTFDLNMRATLRCADEKCGHEWEGRVPSPRYQRLREKGQIL